MSIIETCKKCGEQVRWVRSPTGKQWPVDADPAERGGFWVFYYDAGRLDTAIIRRGCTHNLLLEQSGIPRHSEHWRTCEPSSE